MLLARPSRWHGRQTSYAVTMATEERGIGVNSALRHVGPAPEKLFLHGGLRLTRTQVCGTQYVASVPAITPGRARLKVHPYRRNIIRLQPAVCTASQDRKREEPHSGPRRTSARAADCRGADVPLFLRILPPGKGSATWKILLQLGPTGLSWDAGRRWVDMKHADLGAGHGTGGIRVAWG